MTSYYAKPLSSLLSGMVKPLKKPKDIIVKEMSLDSRSIEDGAVFVALTSDKQQRLLYVKQAVEKLCSAVLFDSKAVLAKEEKRFLKRAKIKYYLVNELAINVGFIAARLYEQPSKQLNIIAVTGTNGKTSVTQLIAQALENMEQACGVIGTLGYGRIGQFKTTGMTTPDPITLQKILAGFVKQNVQTVVLEASSHALVQGRLNGVKIDVAILTNLSRDHLDYHHDMTTYAKAKTRLFNFPTIKTAIINTDDEFGQSLVSQLSQREGVDTLSYSSQLNEASTTVQASDIEIGLTGLQFSLHYKQQQTKFKSQLLGRFNIDNILAALGALMARDITFEDAINALEKSETIDGRMQAYSNDTNILAVIDFAHTPDALEKVLVTLKSHLTEQGQIWCVFGCGGDRDQGKRQVMGQQAERYADHTVITMDNPRSESNVDIVKDILLGINEPDKVHIEHNREQAIHYAIEQASQGDIVLIAGKGHEQYQEIAGEKMPFSDAAAVENALLAKQNRMMTLNESRSL